jgi:phthalate 4,5-dioxygenase oxygenase subunit
MLKDEENIKITRVGPGTPMGQVFRQYWIPAALSGELPAPDGDPIRVRLLGEDLIAFRDTNGSIGLVDAYCPHRRAPMYFGRNEECGLRCSYHGWKFDAAGNCMDAPNEPYNESFRHKIKIKSYPCYEFGGIVWTYMGPQEQQPAYPDHEWCRAPENHRFVSKTYEACNYLQGVEGGIDTAHSSFTHNNNILDKNALRNRATAPNLEVEKMPYGFRYVGTRDLKDDRNYVRVYHFIMPSMQVRGSVQAPKGIMESSDHIPTINGHIWVPIDDEHTYVYNFMCTYFKEDSLPIEKSVELEGRFGRGVHDFQQGFPSFRLKQNKSNDYWLNREVQRSITYTGVRGVNTQDFALQEGMGPICDRTQEKLGTTDIAIIAARQLLFEAMEHVENKVQLRGTDPNTYRHVRATDQILPNGSNWKEVLADEMIARW